MSTFVLLFQTDIKKIKNFIIELVKSPIKLIFCLIYVVWMAAIILQLFFMPGEMNAVQNIDIKNDIVVIIINILAFSSFALSLYSGSKEISGLFTMADVNFIFAAPISSKKILAYGMIKSCLKSILFCVTIVLLLPLFKNVFGTLHYDSIIYTFAGAFVLSAYTVPFSFLSFILTSRFGLKRLLYFFLYGVFAFIMGWILYGIYINKDLFSGVVWVFEQSWYQYIPIIGWSSHLISTIFLGKTSLTIVFLLLQVAVIGVLIFFAVYLAEDYYEDVLPWAEKITAFKKDLKENKNSSIMAPGDSKKKVREVNVNVSEGGPWAFLWMKLVIQKRRNGGFVLQWKNIVLIGLSLAFALLYPDKTVEVYYIVSGAIAYITFIFFSFMIDVEMELKKKYIFLLPGYPWQKILALSIIPTVNTFVYLVCILLPIGVIYKVSFFPFVSGLMLPMSMVILNHLTTTLINLLIPSKFDQKIFYPLIRMVSFLLFLVPPIILGTVVMVNTMSIAWTLLSASGFNIILSLICLFITDRLFLKVEIR